jgi:glycosyltransferase involved in cell wall biosynthesis
MKVLWLGNIMLPCIAEQLYRSTFEVKEGWVTGAINLMLAHQEEEGIEFSYAFPAGPELNGYRTCITTENGPLRFFSYYEDKANAHVYGGHLEDRMNLILDLTEPDVVHCFGTEYGHTLAMAKCLNVPSSMIIGIQGLCSIYAQAYTADLPEQIQGKSTLRDKIKKDSILNQQTKFVQRGDREIEAISLSGNLAGRTEFDRYYCNRWNPGAPYYVMNEILRPEFYADEWPAPHMEPHRIFVSQGDYPIKGIHYMLLAMPRILRSYPDATLVVAGNNLIKRSNYKDILKRSAYGRYLLKLIADNHLQRVVTFTDSLREGEMKAEYMKCGLYVCCSAMENSPNSLGEAMMLGVPCVAADVGGIPSMFTDGQDGILYHGYRSPEISFYTDTEGDSFHKDTLAQQVNNLEEAILDMWSDPERMHILRHNAQARARITHDPEKNYRKILEVYKDMMNRNSLNKTEDSYEDYED